MSSLGTRIRELEAFREEFLSGGFPQRSALGPGAISSQFLRSKSITSNMLDVSELSAVAANTGALTVTGSLVAGSGATTMGYDPATGLYIGAASIGAAPFGVTPAGAMTSTSATITGSVTANTLSANGSGSIAGWTIDSTKLSQGNTGIGASGVYRMWSGNLGTPASANFSVDSSGNIKSNGGSIAGMTVDSSKMIVGNAGVGSSGGYNLWSGNATPSSAPFRVDTSGNMVSSAATITGAVTANSGSFTGSITTSNLDANGGTMAALTVDGTITIGTGGKIQWNSTGSFIDDDEIAISSSGSSKITFRTSGTTYGGIYTSAGQMSIVNGNSANFSIEVTGGQVDIAADDGFNVYTVGAAAINLSSADDIYLTLGDAGGTNLFYVRDSGAQPVFGVNSNGDLIRPITNDATGLGAYYGRVPIYINGTLKYLGVYDA